MVARGFNQPAERDLSWLATSVGVSLSADGRRALFYESNAGEQYRVAWREVDGSPVRDLGEGMSQGISPDGSWALAITMSLPEHVVLYSVGTGGTVHLSRGSLETIKAACWHQDSKSVIIVGNEPSKPQRVFRQDIAGGLPTPLLPEGIVPLTSRGVPMTWSAVDPEGKRIAATGPGGSWGLYPLDGGPARKLTALTSVDFVLGWSSDGRSLYVRSGQDVPARIEAMDVDTGRRSLFMEIKPSDSAGLVSIDPSSLADSGQQYAYTYHRRLTTLFVVSGAK